jgi:hypothetical protein
MQRIVKLWWSPEQYAAKGLERTISRPAEWPNCAKGRTLEAHGYYWRWVNALQEGGHLVRIRVRRFFLSLVPAHREFIAQLRVNVPVAEQSVSRALLFR